MGMTRRGLYFPFMKKPSPDTKSSRKSARKPQEKKPKRFVPKFRSDDFRDFSIPLSPDEYEFEKLASQEWSFAEFWEYRREIKRFYQDKELPVDGSPNSILWLLNKEHFPMPFLELKRSSLLRTRLQKGNNQKSLFANGSPVFNEIDPFQLLNLVKNPPFAHGRKIRAIGTSEFSRFAIKLKDIPEEAYYSAHAISLDWRKGRDAIKSEFGSWLDTKFKEHGFSVEIGKSAPGRIVGRKEADATNTRLAQLAAWRAKRAGLSATDFIRIRFENTGIDFVPPKKAQSTYENLKLKSRQLKKVTGWPSYFDRSSFHGACSSAEARLKEFL